MKILKNIAFIIVATISIGLVFIIGLTLLVFCIETIKNSYVNFVLALVLLIGMNMAVAYVLTFYDKLNN